MASNTLPTGEVARRTKPSAELASVEECHGGEAPLAVAARVEHVSNACDWKMVPFNDAPGQGQGHQGSVDVGTLEVKTLNLGSYQSPTFSTGLHDLIGLDTSQRAVHESATTNTMAPHFSNASSLVTSLGSSREASPDRYGDGPSRFVGPSSNMGAWIPTAQLRPVLLTTAQLPAFASWNDA